MSRSAALRPSPCSAHVKGGVHPVGESPFLAIDLQGTESEIGEHRVNPADADIGEHLGQFVVDGLHESGPFRQGTESFPGHGQGIRVAVDADEPRRGSDLQDRPGVATEPQGAVDIDGAGRGEGRGQQLYDAAEHDRFVNIVARLHGRLPPAASSGPLLFPSPGRRFLHRNRTWPRGRKARVSPGDGPPSRETSLPQLGQQFRVKFGETGFLLRLVLGPVLGVPDLGPVHGADHHDVAFQTRIGTEDRGGS